MVFSPKNPIARLAASGLAITGGVLSPILTPENPQPTALIVSSVVSMLGNIGVELFGSAFEERFIKQSNRSNILRNGDLTRVIGKAVFVLFLEEAKETSDQNDKEILNQIGNSDLFIWEEIVFADNEEDSRVKIDKKDLEEISINNLTQYFKAKGDDLNNLTALSQESWRQIVEKLCDKHRRMMSVDSANKTSARLNKDFPKALRKVLIDDFAQDGKAYASLQLRISGEILSYVSEIKDDTGQIRQDTTQLLTLSGQILQIVLGLEKKTTGDYQRLPTGEWKKILMLLENFPKPQTSLAKFQPSDFPNQNEYFTGRKNVLDNLKTQLETQGKASLFGLHGLGKTQTVLKYAELHQKEYRHILFINAAKDIFLTSMAKFQEIFSLPWQHYARPKEDWSDDEKRCFAVKDFLDNDAVWSQKNQRFLLIFDNVDDTEQIKSFIPKHNQGDILFTSNSKSIKNRAPKVEIEELEEKDSILLLYRRGTRELVAEFERIPDEKQEVLGEIARELAYLPVFLENAAVTIAETPLKFEKFLEKLRKSSPIDLEKEHPEIDYPHKTAKNGFAISFGLMCEADEKDSDGKLLAEIVREVLFAASILAPDNIPEELLKKYVEKFGNHLSVKIKDEDFWEKVRAKLTKYDLLEYDVEKETFDMHRFVQYVIWNYLILESK